MAQYAERKIGINEKNNGDALVSAIVGILAYFILVVPILSLTVVEVLNLSGNYFMPTALAWWIVGLYVTEKYAFRNI